MTITERIAELQEYARQDGERCNENSIADFLAFPRHIEGMEGPYLYMEDNGNIRAVWRNMTRRFGIEFLGGERAQLLAGLVNQKPEEIFHFNLTDLPTRLTPRSFLAFVKNNVYEEQPEEAQHAIL